MPESLISTVLPNNQKSEIPNSDTSIQSQSFQDEYVIKKSESFFGTKTIEELKVKTESLDIIDPIHQEAEINTSSPEKKSETVQDFDELFIKNFEKFNAEIKELKVQAKSFEKISNAATPPREFKKPRVRSWLDSNRAQNPSNTKQSVKNQSQKTINLPVELYFQSILRIFDQFYLRCFSLRWMEFPFPAD